MSLYKNRRAASILRSEECAYIMNLVRGGSDDDNNDNDNYKNKNKNKNKDKNKNKETKIVEFLFSTMTTTKSSI